MEGETREPFFSKAYERAWVGFQLERVQVDILWLLGLSNQACSFLTTISVSGDTEESSLDKRNLDLCTLTTFMWNWTWQSL